MSAGLPVEVGEAEDLFVAVVDAFEADNPVTALLIYGRRREHRKTTSPRRAWWLRTSARVAALLSSTGLLVLYTRLEDGWPMLPLFGSYAFLAAAGVGLARDAPRLANRIVRVFTHNETVAAALLVLFAGVWLGASFTVAGGNREYLAVSLFFGALLLLGAHGLLSGAAGGRRGMRRFRRSASQVVWMGWLGFSLAAAYLLFVSLSSGWADSVGVRIALGTTLVTSWLASRRSVAHRRRRVEAVAIEAVDAAVIALSRAQGRSGVTEGQAEAALLRLEAAMASGIDVGSRIFRSPLETASYRAALAGFRTIALSSPAVPDLAATRRVLAELELQLSTARPTGVAVGETACDTALARDSLIYELRRLREELLLSADVAA